MHKVNKVLWLVLALLAAPAAAQDAVDPHQCTLTPSPVVNWPATTTLTSAVFRPDGLHLEFDKKEGPGRWPDVHPDGWKAGDTIQYTIWFGAFVNNRCHLAASLNWWHGRGELESGPV